MSKPRLSGFEFLECLGQGAFGQVWKVRDLGLGAVRAVKLVDPARFRERDVRRLLAEARAVARLPNHRNRVVVHQVKDGVTNCFLIMDYVAGGSLDRLTSPGQPMPWPRAVRYIAGVGDGLLEVHQRDMLHRDIKPSNILLDPDRDEAVLGDFGLAAALGGPDRVAGTRGYMAPEVSQRGKAGPRSDVYSLAAALLHLVTGRPPAAPPVGETRPDADGASSFGPVAPAGGPCWPADVPEEVRAVIAAGMEPVAERRADLPCFLGMLREARWQRLAGDVLGRQPAGPTPVRLQVTVASAAADAPDSFTPLPARELLRRRLHTGDRVRIDSVADANGHLTVLLLGSAGGLEVVLPRPTAADNFFSARQQYRLLLRLAPPAGRERVLVLWSRQGVRRSDREWLRWLERRGEDLFRAAPRPTRGVRCLEVEGEGRSAPPEGSWRAVVVPLDHASPGPAGEGGSSAGPCE
jgi:hypothetical protein